MARVSTLNVLVKATTAPFKRALKGVMPIARNFGASMVGIGVQVAKFGTILGTAAVAGVVALTKHAYSTIDAMGKLSSNIGIATEAIAGFHLAAELGGVSTEAMDKALTKMVRSVGQAGQGLSTQVRAFDMIGLSFDKLARMTPEQQFAAIADGISKLGNSSQQAAVAADIFGRAGVDLLNILKGGAAGFAAAQADADAFGLSLSRLDTKKVEDANDAITRVKSAFKGIGTQIAVFTAPMVEWLSKKFTDAAKSGGGIGEKVKQGADIIAGVIGGVLDGIDVLKMAYLGMQALVMKGFELMAKAAEESLNTLIAGINVLLPEKHELADFGSTFSEGFKQGIEDIQAKVDAIKFGPTGKERVKKFFSMVAEESARSAQAALDIVGPPAPPDTPVSTQRARVSQAAERSLQIGFRSQDFIDALRGNSAVSRTQTTPTDKRIDHTNDLLEQMLTTLRTLNMGLA